MSDRSRIWPVLVSFLAAIALEIVPLSPALQVIRPPFVVMTLIYWTMMWPQRFGVLSAFLLGISLDILQGQLLGQYALTFVSVAYLTIRFHLQIRIFPLWQLTMTVLALLMVSASLQFIIAGIAGFGNTGFSLWLRVIVGTLLWPVVMGILDRLRTQVEIRPSRF